MKLEALERENLMRVKNQAAECTVLLKSNGAFPLSAPGPIAAFGNGVRHTVKGGTGSGEVNSRFSINIEQGLKKAGFTITSTEWLDAYDDVLSDARKQFIKELHREAKEQHQNYIMYCMGKIVPEPDHDLPLAGDGDTAIYVVSRNSGEGADREPIEGDIKLTATEIRDILALDQMYEKFMLVLNVGGVIDLSPVAHVGNILLISQLGVVTGSVLSGILLGKATPSGKLTATWSAWEDYPEIGQFGEKDDTCYEEGIYLGYRYFDSVGKKALFPFGYGLSYTTFSIDHYAVTVQKDKVTVAATVRNTGSYYGKEVVQVYTSAPCGQLNKPYQDLAAFAKTKRLAPGQEETLTMTFSLKDLASYQQETASYLLEQGRYIIRVGNSSVNTRPVAVLSLSEDVVTLKAKNVLGDPGFQDWIPLLMPAEEDLSEVPVIEVNAPSIQTSEVSYDQDYPVNPLVQTLTNEELAYLLIGGFDPKAKGLSIIGNAATHVAGAAGETTSMLTDKGILPLIMADGPAGLRLAQQYFIDKKGAAHGIGTSVVPQGMLDLLGDRTKFFINLVMSGSKAPKNAVIHEQYTTAIPIGTAIAQSFNTKLAESYGDVVGSEMERFGVQLWLAPALNIHRSIRCGRNFEYFSEDPLVSGLMAAAITKGVQSHSGCGVTIKHYAANNQETNRYTNSSQVSERAMREIYLKGFGICVRESAPHAVMTSYNLLNGIHTSEHRGLIEEILRNEYGFHGIVMTDWVISLMTFKDSKYRTALSAEVAKAGGDLFMPGSKSDYNGVLAALNDGTLSRHQAEINATRVLQ